MFVWAAHALVETPCATNRARVSLLGNAINNTSVDHGPRVVRPGGQLLALSGCRAPDLWLVREEPQVGPPSGGPTGLNFARGLRHGFWVGSRLRCFGSPEIRSSRQQPPLEPTVGRKLCSWLGSLRGTTSGKMFCSRSLGLVPTSNRYCQRGLISHPLWGLFRHCSCDGRGRMRCGLAPPSSVRRGFML